MSSEQSDLELEEQFILRLPLNDAEKIRDVLRSKPDKFKRMLKIRLDVVQGVGNIYIGKKKLYAYLRKFPTIIESYKSNIVNDKANIYKLADICHIVECYNEPLDYFKKDLNHGYTPPMKNVKIKRFRKTLDNPEVIEETELITKELYYLISTDLEAVSTNFEMLYEKNKANKNLNDSIVSERTLFGTVSSSDSDEEN